MRDAFIRALSELADIDRSIVLVNGDLGFGVLDEFIEKRPYQYINAGVAEQNMTAIACGMALEGAKAYTYSIGNFATLRCLEQLRNDVCYHEANVTAVAVGAGFSYGQLGMSHFATEDLAIMRALPNMTVVAPCDAWQAFDLTKQLYQKGGPTYLRLDKGQAGTLSSDGETILGKIRVVRSGCDLVMFATGAILGEALSAAQRLEELGIATTVIDVHTIKPFDADAVAQLADIHGYVLTIEEHNIIGGLGAAVAEAILENGANVKAFARIGLRDIYPSIVGDQRFLRHAYGMDSDAIFIAGRQLLKKEAHLS